MIWPAVVAAFLAAHNTLTLATVDENGLPAAAALFYAEDSTLNLYFLSEAGSGHARHITQQPWAAVTIQADGQHWQNIQGLQLCGVVTKVSGAERVTAMRIYGRKHPFLQPLFRGEKGPATLLAALRTATFYRLRPCWLRLIDNRRTFGYKESWQFPCEETPLDDHED